jgi:hypothetical protein
MLDWPKIAASCPAADAVQEGVVMNPRLVYVHILMVLGSLCLRMEAQETLLPVRRNDVYGYVRSSGIEAIKPQFQEAGPFSGGLAAVKADEKWGYVDSNGSFRIRPRFNDARAFSEGRAAVSFEDGGRITWRFIDSSGAFVGNMQFDEVSDFSETFAAVEQAFQWFYIDRDAQRAFGPAASYDDASPFSEGMAKVKSDGLYEYIDKTGRIAITQRFHDAGSFSQGLAAVSTSPGRWGYIGKGGTIAIAAQFSSAKPFSEGLAAVTLPAETHQEGHGFINKEGRMVIPPEFEQASSFSEGLAAVAVKDKNLATGETTRWGFVDTKGEWVLPPHFLSANNFKGGLTEVTTAVTLLSCYVDRRGRLVSKMSDEQVSGSSLGLMNENVGIDVGLASSPPGAAVYAIPLLEWQIDSNLPNEQDKLWLYHITDSPGITPLNTRLPREAIVFVFTLNGQQKLIKRTITEGQRVQVEAVFP